MHLAFWNYHLHFKFWHRQRSWHRQSLSMHFSAGHSVIQEVHSVPKKESVSSYLAKEGFPWQGEQLYILTVLVSKALCLKKKSFLKFQQQKHTHVVSSIYKYNFFSLN